MAPPELVPVGDGPTRKGFVQPQTTTAATAQGTPSNLSLCLANRNGLFDGRAGNDTMPR